MALKRVLVLIQVFSLLSNRQAHAYKLNKQTKSESVGESNTLSLFDVYMWANLFHGVLRFESLKWVFLLLVKTEKRYLCLRIFVLRFSAFWYCVFISSLVKYLSRHKVAVKKELRYLYPNSNYYTSFKMQWLKKLFLN